MSKQIALVTGANRGLGYSFVHDLVGRGWKVIMLVRKPERGEFAKQRVEKDYPDADLDVMDCDLGSFDSIINFSIEFNSKYESLDLLIHNAGVFLPKRQVTDKSIEMTFMVNYLSRFVLTELVKSKLLASESPKIIDISGEYHKGGTMKWDDLEFSIDYSGFRSNARAKLANVMWVYEFAERNKEIGINTFHPGPVGTESVQRNPDISRLMKFLYTIGKPFMRKPEVSVLEILEMVLREDFKASGNYYVTGQPSKPDERVMNADLRKKLWETSDKLMKKYVRVEIPVKTEDEE